MFPRFENVMPKFGLETLNLCGSVVVDDFDGDDYLDIVTSAGDTTVFGPSARCVRE